MAERYLAVEAQQHVEPDADDRGQPDHDDNEDLIAVAARDEKAHGGDDDRGRSDLRASSYFPQLGAAEQAVRPQCEGEDDQAQT